MRLQHNAATIARELEREASTIAKLVEEAEHRAKLERQRWEEMQEKWRREEAERRHREVGGDRVETWQADKSALEQQREQCLRKQGQAKEAC
ncbi:MAG: hypothetical protein PVG22_09520 [Chromatiales bacterium]